MNGAPHVQTQDLANKAYFDQWAKSYDNGRISKWFQYTQKLALSFVPLRKDSKVLDVGCGTGFAVHQLASILEDGMACGIDVSPRMVQEATAKAPKMLSGRVEFREASSANIPYPADEFDFVLCTNSFHHYPDPLRALREMRRVLRPGGQFVILENAPDLSWYTWAWDHLLRFIEKGHICYYYSHDLEDMLNKSGFRPVRLCYLGNNFLKHGKLFASLQIWSGQKPDKILGTGSEN